MGNIYHEWDGTTLIVTSDSGTSSCDLKGSKGDMGIRGPQGSPSIITDTSGLVLAPADNYYPKEEVDDKLEVIQDELSLAANAATATASGETVQIKDLSPITHNIKVQMKSKNILPFPYYRATPYTQNGITFTLNEDRSITMNGTASGNAYFHFYYGANYLTPGGYALYSPTTNSKVQTTLEFYTGDSTPFTWLKGITQTSATGKTITLSEEEVKKITRCYLFVLVMNGTTLNNYTIRPMVCKSYQVINYYTPYLSDFTGVSLKRYGETESDSLDIYAANADGTVNGVTSLYPITTLVPDNSAVIEVEYNQDTNVVLDNKLTIRKKTDQNYLYGSRPNGEADAMFPCGANATTAYSIPIRDDYGRFCVEAPINDKQVANKKYVDDKVADAINSSGGSVTLYEHNIVVDLYNPSAGSSNWNVRNISFSASFISSDSTRVPETMDGIHEFLMSYGDVFVCSGQAYYGDFSNYPLLALYADIDTQYGDGKRIEVIGTDMGGKWILEEEFNSYQVYFLCNSVRQI